MNVRHGLTSLKSPKASTLRRVNDGLRVASVVIGVAMIVCCVAVPPLAIASIATFCAVEMAGIAVDTARRHVERRDANRTTSDLAGESDLTVAV